MCDRWKMGGGWGGVVCYVCVCLGREGNIIDDNMILSVNEYPLILNILILAVEKFIDFVQKRVNI